MTGRAEQIRCDATRDAAGWEDEVDEPRDPRYGQPGDVSVPEVEKECANRGA
jgi:hypothetical protein